LGWYFPTDRVTTTPAINGSLPCASAATFKTWTAFEPTSKRRKGFPSETSVERGVRIVHGDKELIEKLGREDPCPCGSMRLFQTVLPEIGQAR